MYLYELVEVSYNLPKLSSYAQWNPNGTAFPDGTRLEVFGELFVDRNNTVYLANRWGAYINMWYTDGTNKTIILEDFFTPRAFFVTMEGDIYVSSDDTSEVKKWSQNETEGIVVMNTTSSCRRLFVDIDNYLYCSLAHESRIVKQSLNDAIDIQITVAGTDDGKVAADILIFPIGIFVDTNFDLYVADCWGGRIQLFKFGKRSGITVAGKGSTSNIELHMPTDVFLDADGYLFIIDGEKSRIIGSSLHGFYCVIGCSSPFQGMFLFTNSVPTAAFDSYGNMFVVDRYSLRIQKYILMTNISSKYIEM